MASKCRGRKDQTLASSAAALPHPSPPMVEMAFADLTDLVLDDILDRLTPVDLLRAALACRSWLRAATRVLPRVPPPILGYFVHPRTDKTHHPAVFLPLQLHASPRLSLHLAKGAASSLSIQDVHHGLVLLLPHSRPKSLLPRILVVDPASRRRVTLPAPPRDTLPHDPWRCDRSVVGVAVLARAHPSRLTFDIICLTIDGHLPRAWVASVRQGNCAWRALPRAQGLVVNWNLFDTRCVHAAGNVYCNMDKSILQLNPRTMHFSLMPIPAVLVPYPGCRTTTYRIGETPVDGRLCMAAIKQNTLNIWVRSDTDTEWLLEREILMFTVLQTIPRNIRLRMLEYTWITDIDYARTGRVFIGTWGYGRYAFHLETGKLERLVMKDGKEHGDPIYAYTLAWPPEFLTPRN